MSERYAKMTEIQKKKESDRKRKWYQANSERIKDKHREWRGKNSKKVRDYYRKKYQANPEKVRDQARKWRKANPEKANASNRKWYQSNPEKARAHVREWLKENPEKANIYSRKHRALKYGQIEHYNELEWKLLCEQYENHCIYPGCNRTDLTPDHVIPLVMGGKDTIDNIQPLCRSHNCSKGATYMDYRNRQPVKIEQLSFIEMIA